MKVLLVSPPYYKIFGSFNNRINVGLHTIAEILNHKEFNVSLLNLDHKNNSSLINRKSILKNSNVPEMSVIEKAKNTLRSNIEEFTPDSIIFSIGDIVIPSLDCGSPEIAEILAGSVKSDFPDIHLVSYGPLIRKTGLFDLNIEGFAEEEICSLLLNKKNGSVKTTITNGSLEDLPFLTLDYLKDPIEHKDFDYISQSRGCQYKCSFCSAPLLSNGTVYTRTSKRFVEEMIFRHEKYNVKNYYFTDMTFNHSTENLKLVCNELAEKNLDIEWRCDSRVDLITDEQASLLESAGCTFIKLGIEAMNNDRLKFLNKKFTIDTIKTKIKILKKYNIQIVVYILLGHPDYSKKDYLNELELFKELNADKYTVSILNPSPGSKLYSHISLSSYPLASHLNLNLTKNWNIDVDIIEKYYDLELQKGREDADIRSFK